MRRFGDLEFDHQRDVRGGAAYGHTSRQSPAALGTPVTEGDYTIVVNDVGSTTRSEDGKYYTLDGRRLIIKGSLTCNLPANETCIMKKLDPSVSIPESTLDLWPKQSLKLQSIDGGGTVDFRFETHGWIRNNRDTTGSLMKLEFQGSEFLEYHTAWFDLGFD
ncbi:MAG: hypothetical protein U9R53_04770 [Chloroflexota bacterium]|nr:hypothetical protein [Chloroflexota bacterium]